MNNAPPPASAPPQLPSSVQEASDGQPNNALVFDRLIDAIGPAYYDGKSAFWLDRMVEVIRLQRDEANTLPAIRTAAEKALAAWEPPKRGQGKEAWEIKLSDAMADLRTALNAQPKTK